jgi:hypothetical protein
MLEKHLQRKAHSRSKNFSYRQNDKLGEDLERKARPRAKCVIKTRFTYAGTPT